VTSAALSEWNTDRAARLDRLVAAHRAVRGVNRRWVTDELNHALVLRLASEFQGFARALHEEASRAVVATLIPNDPDRQDALLAAFLTGRRLNSGNAQPGVLRRDFGCFGLSLWAALDQRFPSRATAWRGDLSMLNTARNCLAHDDIGRLAIVLSSGWTTKLPHVLRWRRTLDALAKGMDQVLARTCTTWWGTAMVRGTGMKKRPRINDRVVVNFGFQPVIGRVIDVHGKGEHTWVMVELNLDIVEDAEPEIMSYPLDRVQPAEAA
jgi:hypothetical protein